MSDTVSDLFQQTRTFAAKCFGFSQQLPTATFMANGTGPVLVKFLCTELMGGKCRAPLYSFTCRTILGDCKNTGSLQLGRNANIITQQMGQKGSCEI